MLDASVEEPTYPAHEWQGPAEPHLVMPDEASSNEALIEGARRLVQIVGWRMRRTVQEWWLIGRHLAILMDRPENEGRWRKEILPEIGVDHETDYRLRKMSQMVPFEACHNYPNKTRLMRDVGILPPQQPKRQIELQHHAEVEKILGLSDAETYDLGGVDRLPQAAPIEELQPGFGMEAEEQVDDDEAAAKPAKATPRPQSAPRPEANKVAAKAIPQPKATKIAAKAAPQAKPQEKDPMDGTEALVVTLDGASDADLEAVVAESGLTPIAKTPGRVVGIMWYGQEKSLEAAKAARQRVYLAVGRLRDEKKKLLAEIHYLELSEVIPV